MRWANLACLSVTILGVVLFLYGANFYDAVVGWVGVYLLFGGVLAFLALYVYGELSKRTKVQNP